MMLPDNDISFDLKPGRAVELPDAALYEIACIEGALWITQLGEPRDMIVEAGQSIVLDHAGSALIGAINGPARVLATPLHQLALAA